MKNNAANWGGFLTLMGCLLVSTIFFAFVMLTQPGPVDSKAKAAAGLTHEEYIQRKETWIKSTSEAIQQGQVLYNLNCAYCHGGADNNLILSRFQSGDLKYGKTELEVYAVISKGINGTTMTRMDHLHESERWSLVHYLRSLNSNLPTTKKSHWKIFFSEQGI